MMLIRFGELLDRRMTKLILNRLPMTQKEEVEEAMHECRNRERIKNGLPPIGGSTTFAKAAGARALDPVESPGPNLLQMPRPGTSSPLSQVTQRSATISQVSGIRAERDMTGKLRYDFRAPLQGADLASSIQIESNGKGQNGHAQGGRDVYYQADRPTADLAFGNLSVRERTPRKSNTSGHDDASNPASVWRENRSTRK